MEGYLRDLKTIRGEFGQEGHHLGMARLAASLQNSRLIGLVSTVVPTNEAIAQG